MNNDLEHCDTELETKLRAYGRAGIRNPEAEPETETDLDPEPEPEPEPKK